MYFDGLFFGRLDYNDKSKREIEKKMEFVWQGSDDLGRASDLFTGSPITLRYIQRLVMPFSIIISDISVSASRRATQWLWPTGRVLL